MAVTTSVSMLPSEILFTECRDKLQAYFTCSSLWTTLYAFTCNKDTSERSLYGFTLCNTAVLLYTCTVNECLSEIGCIKKIYLHAYSEAWPNQPFPAWLRCYCCSQAPSLYILSVLSTFTAFCSSEFHAVILKASTSDMQQRFFCCRILSQAFLLHNFLKPVLAELILILTWLWKPSPFRENKGWFEKSELRKEVWFCNCSVLC